MPRIWFNGHALFQSGGEPEAVQLVPQAFKDDLVIFLEGDLLQVLPKLSLAGAMCMNVCAGLGLHMKFERGKTEARAVLRGKLQIDHGGLQQLVGFVQRPEQHGDPQRRAREERLREAAWAPGKKVVEQSALSNEV